MKVKRLRRNAVDLQPVCLCVCLSLFLSVFLCFKHTSEKKRKKSAVDRVFNIVADGRLQVLQLERDEWTTGPTEVRFTLARGRNLKTIC